MKERMTNATATAIKMLETLPEEAQDYIVERMREYIEDLRDEKKWESMFEKYKASLEKTAKQVREQSATGKTKPMDFDKL